MPHREYLEEQLKDSKFKKVYKKSSEEINREIRLALEQALDYATGKPVKVRTRIVENKD